MTRPLVRVLSLPLQQPAVILLKKKNICIEIYTEHLLNQNLLEPNTFQFSFHKSKCVRRV